MKKNFIWSSLVAILGIFCSFSALSNSGTIKFTGSIVSETCTVSGSSGTDVEVKFDNVHLSELNGRAGKFSAPKPFKIDLTNCPDLKTFSVTFGNENPTADNNYFKVTPPSRGKDQNVAIALYNKSGSSNALIKPGDKIQIPGVKGNTHLPLEAKLISTDSTVTAGDFSRDVKFTISYP
ncbi:fimbrial protein [Photorhabdus asymbiotica]|uniref:fimbrial protein n=1 Tax=Photorhabdus asymbiotica TaxID=291112 RepID=UPI003DA77541